MNTNVFSIFSNNSNYASIKTGVCHRTWHLAFLLFALLITITSLQSVSYLTGNTPSLSYNNTSATNITISINLGEFSADNNGNISLSNDWEKFVVYVKGLPVIAINLAIEDAGDYSAVITEKAETAFPSKSNVPSGTNAVDLRLGKSYIYRDIRGVTLYTSPIRFSGDSLYAIKEMTIKLTKTSKTGTNPKLKTGKKLNPYFIDNYKNHFLNFNARYEDIGEVGSMAVICYGNFMNQMIPYVKWKRQKGIPTQIYAVSAIGDTYSDLKAFIQNLYDTDSTLTFVQLVGDIGQVPSLIEGEGNAYGPRDPYYTLLEGDDYYPDIFVGRFSAETASELNTQIVRSLEYEKGIHAGSWMSKAAVVCAENPPIPGDDNEYNWEHLRNIRSKLLNYTYTTVDSVFANWGADTQDLANSINEGKSLLVYTGEGYETYWITPEFHTYDVEQLINDNMLPFIHVVSCMTGQFADYTCLAEAFMRAENSTTLEPAGAIGIYAAAPHQGISVPMRSQDHFIDLLVHGTKNTIGGLVYNGSCNMIDVYGAYGGEYNFLGWNLFGDSSLALRTKQPDSLEINVSSTIAPGTTSLIVQTNKPDVQVCLTRNTIIIASGFTDINGAVNLNWTTPSVTGESFSLTCTGFNCNVIEKTILCYAAGEAYLTITDYIFYDNEDGIINSGENIDLRAHICNSSLVPAEDVYVEMVCSDTLLVITRHTDNLGTINSYESDYAHLEFSVSKYCPDYRLIQYDIITHFGADSLAFTYQIMVQSPCPEIMSVKTLPEIEWLNPGDDAIVQYEIHNSGSAKLKNTNVYLTSGSPDIQILQPMKTISIINPDSTYYVGFAIRIKPETEPNTLFHLDLHSVSDNAQDMVYTENHLVIPAGEMMESFEPGMENRFTWLHPLGGQWHVTDIDSYDGKQCFISPSAAVSLTSSAEISFELHEFSIITFHYRTHTVNPGSYLKLYINDELQFYSSGISEWREASMYLYEGQYTFSWRFESTASAGSQEEYAELDAIRFAAGTIFTDAILESDVQAVEINIHPDQVIHTPLYLSSKDGRYIDYTTVIRNADNRSSKDGYSYIASNRYDLIPGDYNRYILTCYNTHQDRTLSQIRILIPEGVAVTSASNFSMSGEQPLIRMSMIGSENTIIWANADGTEADSLRCVLTLLSDISMNYIFLECNICTCDNDNNTFYETNYLVFNNNTEPHVFLMISPVSGTLIESEETRITISCIQEQLPQNITEYVLEIYYNGINSLSIPVTISYDPTPGIDTSKPAIRNYPNPFSRYTTIDYYLPEEGEPDIQIYNIKGQKVISFTNPPKYAGNNKLIWDGKFNNNQNLPSGVYFIKLKTSQGLERVAKCLLIK